MLHRETSRTQQRRSGARRDAPAGFSGEVARRGDIWRRCDYMPGNSRASRTPMPPQTNSNASPNSLNFEARGTFLGTVKLLTPYIWPTDRADLKLRVMLAIVCMIASKLVTIATPYAFKYATDALAHAPDGRHSFLPAALNGMFALTALYGGLRILMALTPAGPRRVVCGGGDERGASAGDRGVRPSASSVAALSSRAQDRRPHPRSRARPQRDRDHHPHLDADRGPDRAWNSR